MIPNNVELGPGEIYICDSAGSWSRFGNVSELNCTIEDDDLFEASKKLMMVVSEMEVSLMALARVSRDGMAAILGLTQAVLEQCPNRRVVHLARYAKKHRTRKKNLHRAFRILEDRNG